MFAVTSAAALRDSWKARLTRQLPEPRSVFVCLCVSEKRFVTSGQDVGLLEYPDRLVNGVAVAASA
jgi:hypothetical protein